MRGGFCTHRRCAISVIRWLGSDKSSRNYVQLLLDDDKSLQMKSDQNYMVAPLGLTIFRAFAKLLVYSQYRYRWQSMVCPNPILQSMQWVYQLYPSR